MCTFLQFLPSFTVHGHLHIANCFQCGLVHITQFKNCLRSKLSQKLKCLFNSKCSYRNARNAGIKFCILVNFEAEICNIYLHVCDLDLLYFLAQGFQNQTLLNSSSVAGFLQESGSLFIAKRGVKFPRMCTSCRLWLLREYSLYCCIGFPHSCFT